MLDEFRNTAFMEEEEEAPEEKVVRRNRKARSGKKFLGMTAPQRFLLSLMLFMMTSVFGLLVLLITERIYLP